MGEPVKDLLTGGLYFVRRTFLNQAPVVAPVTVTAGSSGPVTGSIGATDPDGDRIVYRLVRGPESGTVQINADGTYTYTPGADFDGVATFSVAAHDVGLHVNLADLLRPVSTRADVLVNQGAVTFSFNYTVGAEHWTPERQAALRDAADFLVGYFMVNKPVTLTYDVEAYEDWASPTLAAAFSQLIDTEPPGFFPGIVQHKLLTGVDANDEQADGWISWNFGRDWALSGTASSTQLDFRATALHELTHSLGFTSSVDGPGNNTNPNRADFDRWITTADGISVMGADGQWNSTFDPNLTGGNGGLYFAGPNAVAAYGAPVPLYTPDPWEAGSSGAHLDDHTFAGDNRLVMNAATVAGPGLHALSPIELAILADLGYVLATPTVVAPTKPWAVQASSPTSERQQQVADDIAAFVLSSRAFIAALPVAAPVKDALTGTLFTLRRALLNQAPVVTSVVQFSGSANTPVQARVDAVDPDGDRIVYRLVQGPKSGTVQVNSDGSYIFTPGSDFNGVDTFVVAAYDTGLHLNLLDLFRAPATLTKALVNQGAVRFDFDYTSGAQYWTPERRAALNSAADQFGAYFLVTAPRVLAFTVTGMDDAETSTLASAESFPVFTEDDGIAEIFRTVVQHKLITGEDDNGEAADGRITWNFAQPWGLGATTGEDEFDFTAVAIHELMHSVGFVSVIEAPGTNEDSDWTVFDSFVATADGTKVILPDRTWNTAYDANLLGGNGGLYFAGANAVAAQGGPVRLYTPREFLPTSSVSHLSQRVFEGMIMVPISSLGPRSRDLSAVELGILQDIGFTVVTPVLISA